MARRITDEELYKKVKYLNLNLNRPVDRWDGEGNANVGNYHLESQGGVGVSLSLTRCEAGSVYSVSPEMTKREMYNALRVVLEILGEERDRD
tara:strand:+ start:778 stop:1053 length:276 start_codon:yes stop_codon:yes gene_type:complete